MMPDFTLSNKRRLLANSLIPGGAHTYSKGDDLFPLLSPHSIVKGKGAWVWDVDGNAFIDWGMGLSSVILGHAYEPVLDTIKKELDNGVNFIRPSYIEAETAELLIDTIPSIEMIKFAKNGSNVTSAAVKLARAYTGKKIILRCFDHPFFSFDDWFIADTPMSSGIPNEISQLTKHFRYNDLSDLQNKVAQYEDEGIACIILEPASTVVPKEGYLQALRKLCTAKGIILIFDEIISGFRFHPKGAHFLYGVEPDLCTFGKAMGNGFSVAALAGKRDIMQLGGLKHDKERLFLLSATYGGETHHLKAVQTVVKIMHHDDFKVTRHIWNVGKTLKEAFNAIAKKCGIEERVFLDGIDCRPFYVFPDNTLRTLFMQEMIKHGVLSQEIMPSFSHQESEIAHTIEAFEKSLETVAHAMNTHTVDALLVGNAVKKVFRKFN